METYVSVREAARIRKVTRQAIYLAIREKKLRAYRHGNTFKVFLMDLVEYDRNKYSRVHHSIFDGVPMYDESKGLVTVERASQMIGVLSQKLYYAIRTGMLKAERKKNAYIINVEELFKYQDKYLRKDFTRKKIS